jgi:group I intron endonuclease
MIHYVYITTNLINGKHYIGDRSCDCDPKQDNYLGSGKPAFKNAVKEYGKKNFQKEILEFFNTRKEAFDAQEKYIKQFNTLSPNGYNISPTGGNNVRGCHSRETRKKMSLSAKGKHNIPCKEEAKEKLRIANTGQKRSFETKRKQKENNLGEKNPMYGKIPWNKGKKLSKEQTKNMHNPKSLEHKNKLKKKRTQETKNNIAKSWEKRRIEHPTTKETREKQRNNMLGENNPMFGKNHTEETKHRQSVNHRGGVEHHSKESKRKISESQIGNKRNPEVGIKIAQKLKGQKQSQETKDKRSESLKLAWAKRKNNI